MVMGNLKLYALLIAVFALLFFGYSTFAFSHEPKRPLKPALTLISGGLSAKKT
jgi:cbb3-type cytochrome oxidase subunit 3